MEKNDLAIMKAENERLVTDIEKLKQRLREEITRTHAGVRLDLNLEKGLYLLTIYLWRFNSDSGFAGRLRDEASQQEIKLREVDTRIETEIAGLRTAIQTSKATTLQYLVTFGKRLRSHHVILN